MGTCCFGSAASRPSRPPTAPHASRRTSSASRTIRTCGPRTCAWSRPATTSRSPPATGTVVTLVEADAALEHVSLRALADTYRSRIARAIEEYRAARAPERLLQGALRALAATVAALVADRPRVLARAASSTCSWIGTSTAASSHWRSSRSSSSAQSTSGAGCAPCCVRITHAGDSGARVLLPPLRARPFPVDAGLCAPPSALRARSVERHRPGARRQHSQPHLPRHPLRHRPLRAADDAPVLRRGRAPAPSPSQSSTRSGLCPPTRSRAWRSSRSD